MSNLEEATQKLNEALKQRATLTTMLGECVERAKRLDAEYKTAVEVGEPDSKLDAMDDKIRRLDRERVRLEIKINAANAEIPALESERDSAAKAESLERLRGISSEIVRAVAVMDRNIAEMANSKQQIDLLLGDCVTIAAGLKLPAAKYSTKFQSELKRALNWQVLKSDDNLVMWSGALKAHYSQPLARQVEKLLLDSADVVEEREQDTNGKVVKLVDAQKEAS